VDIEKVRQALALIRVLAITLFTLVAFTAVRVSLKTFRPWLKPPKKWAMSQNY
jgi:hypothetical protein